MERERDQDPFIEGLLDVGWLWPAWREGLVAGGMSVCAPASQVFGNRVLLRCRKFKLWFVCINNWTRVLIRDNLSGK